MKKFFATAVSVYIALGLIASFAVAFHGGAYEGNTILENRAPPLRQKCTTQIVRPLK